MIIVAKLNEKLSISRKNKKWLPMVKKNEKW